MAVAIFKKRVLKVQNELKAPKGQYNSFGKYRYRSCEDILEAAKPLCAANDLILTLSDEIVSIEGRIYVKATAEIRDTEADEAVSTVAYAREPETKKGMDESQITGTASSYARKYALNGLLCIDDSKDADTDEYKQQGSQTVTSSSQYVCSVCGCTISDYTKNDGSVTPAATVYKNCGGKCLKCYQAAKANGS